MSVLRDLDRDVYVKLCGVQPRRVNDLHKYVVTIHGQPIPYYSSSIVLAHSLVNLCNFRMFVNSNVIYFNGLTLRFQVKPENICVGYCVMYLNDKSWVRKLGGKV